MEIGYDPHRLRQLSWQARNSIGSLTALRSNDPAAAEAMHSIRLFQRHLEDQWMPLISQIEASTAMTSWLATIVHSARSGESTTSAWLTFQDLRHWGQGPRHWTKYSKLSDNELLDLVEYWESDQLLIRDLVEDPDSDLTIISSELAFRVKFTAGFSERLVALAPSTSLVAYAIGRATFPPEFTIGVVSNMASSIRSTKGPERLDQSQAMQTALSVLSNDPASSLDLLLNSEMLLLLGTWTLFEPDVIEGFVASALYESVRIDPNRINDGYQVLSELTQLANGPLEDGMQPGLARGVAISMAGYIETLAPAIGDEGSSMITVVDVGPDRKRTIEIKLGTYDEVVDLFGALMRDETSQATIGLVLGDFTSTIVKDLDENITDHYGLEYIAQFSDLLADASRAEQAELLMAAAANAKRIEGLGGLIGFGLGSILTAGGTSALTKSLTQRTIGALTDFAAMPDVSQEAPSGNTIPNRAYDLITISAISMVASNAALRVSLGLDDLSDEDWDDVDDQLTAIKNAKSSDDWDTEVEHLEYLSEQVIPALGGYLKRVRIFEGVDEMREARNPVRAD